MTYARRLTTAEARIDPTAEMEVVLRQIRAYNPRPGAWLTAGGTRLKVWQAAAAGVTVAPGKIEFEPDGPALGLSDGSIWLERVQPAGKEPMDGAAWMRGLQGSSSLEVDAEARDQGI